MTALIVIAAILVFILSVLLIPLKLKIGFSEDFEYRLTYAGIKILPKKARKSDKTEAAEEKSATSEQKDDNFIKTLYRENDFPTFLKKIFDLLNALFRELRYILRHTKIRKLRANVNVATGDAATTGIHYGIVCTLIYNFLGLMDSLMNVKFKKVEVNADFESGKSKFNFDTIVLISPLFLIIAAIVILKKYVKIINEEGSVSNGRK